MNKDDQLALAPGQLINKGTLEVVREVGKGRAATVWLARVHNNAFPSKYVAVRALAANATSTYFLPDHTYETEILEKLRKSSHMHPDSRFCLYTFDRGLFDEGKHLCVVTEMLVGNLEDLRNSLDKSKERRLPVPFVKKVIKQKLQALSYLHDGFAFVHTNPVPKNILFSVPNLDAIIEQSLKDPSTADSPPRDESSATPTAAVTSTGSSAGASPPEPILTAKSEQQAFSHDNILEGGSFEVRLTGFDGALYPSDRPEFVQALHLRAPEVVLAYEYWRSDIDIWSVGCLTFEYLTGVQLFQIKPSANADKDAALLLEQMSEITGQELESVFLGMCKKGGKYFDTKTCKLLSAPNPKPQPLENLLRQHKVQEKDVPGAAAFIRRCLSLDPGRRPNAGMLVGDAWLAGV